MEAMAKLWRDSITPGSQPLTETDRRIPRLQLLEESDVNERCDFLFDAGGIQWTYDPDITVVPTSA